METRTGIRVAVIVSLVALGGVLGGCSKKDAAQATAATQPASGAVNAANQDPAATPASAATQPAPLDSAAPAAGPALAAVPQPVEVASGRTIHVRLDSSVSSNEADGQVFHGRLSSPVSVNGMVVIPDGATVTGQIVQADDSGKFNGRAHLELRATELRFGGQAYPLHTAVFEEVSKSQATGSEEKIGGGAVIGGVIGAIAGGGKGAAIGAGAGAGAGTVAHVATKGQRVRIPSETRLTFTLQQPVRL